MDLSILMVFALTLGSESPNLTEDRAPDTGTRSPVTIQEGETPPAIAAFGDSIWGFDTETPTGDNGCLGIEFDGTFFWVTGRNAALGDTHKLHKFDSLGNLIISYNQGTTSLWGWRDLAWDGTYLYASDSPLVTQIDPATGSPTGTTISGPLNPNRALAYDPATDHFWTANFGSSIYEFTRAGAIINTFANTRAIYGMAWDNASPGGPWLWASAQMSVAGTPDTVFQINPLTGAYTGVQFPVTDLAGGLAFSTEWIDTLGVAFHLSQTTPDRVVAFEITSVAPTHNVGVSNIGLPGTIVPPNTPISPEVTYCNTGGFDESLFMVYIEIDSASTVVYSDSAQVPILMSDSCVTVTYSTWTPGDLCNLYDITTYIQLPGDGNPGDDTLTQQTSTFTEVFEIQSGLSSAQPTFDGVISGGEWTDATVIDISDVWGEASPGVLPCNVYLYVMNDGNYLYIALDYLLDDVLNTNDRLVTYFDENNDDLWASDSSEGYYRLFNAAGFRSLYQPMPVGPITGPPVPGVLGGMAMGTNLQYEVAIPFGTQRYELNASPATSDTLGFHGFALDQSIIEEEGWWPTSLAFANETNPSFYGNLILSYALPGVEEGDDLRLKIADLRLEQNLPNPFHSSTAIHFVLPASGFTSLKIYDLTGRLVETLVDGLQKPGVYQLPITNHQLPGSGIYFYRLETGDKTLTRKMTLLK